MADPKDDKKKEQTFLAPAPRRTGARDAAPSAPTPESRPETPEGLLDTNANDEQRPAMPQGIGLLSKPAEVRCQENLEQSIEQQSITARLRAMRRAKANVSKHYINVPLDFDTKQALAAAAHDHDIKMAEIVRDALDFYLRSAGYLQ